MGVSFYTVKQHNLPISSIIISLRMKIAVLFSLVVLVLVAFPNTASGCDCVTYLMKSDSFTNDLKTPYVLKKAGIKIPDSLILKGPKAVCKKLPKVKACLAKQKCIWATQRHHGKNLC